MDDEEKLTEMLKEAYGKKLAKKIAEKVKKFKNNNPGKAFNFIFDDKGNFKAVPKE